MVPLQSEENLLSGMTMASHPLSGPKIIGRRRPCQQHPKNVLSRWSSNLQRNCDDDKQDRRRKQEEGSGGAKK